LLELTVDRARSAFTADRTGHSALPLFRGAREHEGGREVIAMLFMAILAALLLSVCWVWILSRIGGSPGATGGPARGDSSPPPGEMSRPESLEGVLVRQLATSEITRQQYLQAMNRLAVRDAERHPLHVPRE